MKVPFRFLPQLFNTCFVTAEAEINSDVAPPPGADAGSVSVDSSTTTETSGAQTEQTTSGVTAPDGTAAGTEQDDPLAGIPTLEEAQALQAQGIQHAEAIVKLRQALEAQKTEFQPLTGYKPLAEKSFDPAQLQTAYEMVQGLHSKVVDPQTNLPIPDQFTTRPFLEQLETNSPGTVDQMFSDLLQFQVPGQNGASDTLVRHLVRSWGLDPDRVEDYRNIDQRSPSSGFVTPDQLAGIDPKFHEAFKALSPAQREDILGLKQSDGTYPQTALEYLNDKAEALEARKFREQFQQQETQKQEQARQQFEQETSQLVEQDLSTKVQGMYESIHKGLSSQWKPSTDETQSEVEYAKVLGTIASLINPNYRWAAAKALEKVGVIINGQFDQLVNSLESEREAVVRFNRMGDKLQAGQAQSRANLTENQLLAQLQTYALALAMPSANRLQSQSQNLVNSLNGATARHVPNGNAAPQTGGNPFDLPPGIEPFSDAARAHRANVERSLRQ